MRIVLAQVDIKLGDKEANVKKAWEIIRNSKADLLLFPELFTTGFDYRHLRELAESIPGETTDALVKSLGSSLVAGSILEKKGRDIYNTFVLLGREGVLGRYRKVHLFMEEKDGFAPGKDVVAVETEYGVLGLAICYDIRFPDLFNELMRKGAEAVLVCAQFPAARIDHWRTLLRARAIENQYYVLATNRVGKDYREYGGGSMAVDPCGRVLVSGGTREEVLEFKVYLAEVSRMRAEFPILEDLK